ncbi:MAG: methyltransferase domain-containing protein [Alphaproteobacteria bacterium]|nr:methyltransferase domain-containing protein [Alphaproteobacteria bacterium]
MSLTTALKKFLPIASGGSDSETDARSGDFGAKTPLHSRLHVWWRTSSSWEDAMTNDVRRATRRDGQSAARSDDETDSASGARSAMEERGSGVGAAAPGEDPAGGHWSPARIAIHETLFGNGEIRPGGPRRTRDIVSGLSLGKNMNVLHIGAELGGAARVIAMDHHCRITGFEADPDLARAAMASQRIAKSLGNANDGAPRSKASIDLHDLVRVSHADLEHLTLEAKSYDCAIAREVLHTLGDKASLCRAVFDALKPNASFLITDYFVAEGAENSPQSHGWIAREPRSMYPCTFGEARKLLTDAGFQLRSVANITPQHRSDIFNSFARFVVAHERGGVAPDLIEPLLELAELWTNRVAALDAGTVEVCKLVAVRGKA